MIGYYAHHLGIGHVTRANVIAAATHTPVVGFSTRPAPTSWSGRWVRLPEDFVDLDSSAADVTAGGTLHWVPRWHRGLRTRMGLIGNELTQGEIRVMVVDVSVEVAVLARLFGVPVIAMAQPGNRTDRPHRLAYDLADKLLAPWPLEAAPRWPQRWLEKTVHLGTVSRFDGWTISTPDPGRRVLVLWGSGGLDIGTEDIRAAAAATANWQWNVVGPLATEKVEVELTNLNWCGWLDDVWPELCAADVVVTHAGQNALAEVAAARRPAIVVPQERPHGEQRATAAALRRAGIGVVRPAWPKPGQWPHLLEWTNARGGAAWSRWSPGDGAMRAAAVLDDFVMRSL